MSRTGLEGTAVPSKRTDVFDTLGLVPAHEMFFESQEDVGARGHISSQRISKGDPAFMVRHCGMSQPGSEDPAGPSHSLALAPSACTYSFDTPLFRRQSSVETYPSLDQRHGHSPAGPPTLLSEGV